MATKHYDDRASMLMREYEETIKGISKAEQTARDAAKSCSKLDDKLRFHKLALALGAAWKLLRLNYYEYDDATTVPVTHCPQCGQVEYGQYAWMVGYGRRGDCQGGPVAREGRKEE